MERLTARNSIGQVFFPHCFREDTCDGEGASDKCNVCDFNQKIADTLAAFEDLQDMLGIPFESLVELCKEEIPDECKNPSKAIILTDESVDEWQQYKALKEAMRKDYGIEIDMDIRTIRKAERTKTIDEFADRMKQLYPTDGHVNATIHRALEGVMKQMKENKI